MIPCVMNFVPIFIAILCCGALFVYFNMRLAEIKNSVEKQNRVLTAFITNVQTDIKNGGTMLGANLMPGYGAGTDMAGASMAGADTIASTCMAGASANHLASPEALRAVNDKIVVSDDESSGSEDDSDDSDDEDDDEIEDVEATREITIINLHDDCVNLELIQDIEQISEIIVDSSSVGLDEESLKIVDIAKTEANYEQMKVDDLRKVVLDLSLAGKDDVKKLKKPELLVLLKNKKN